MSTFKPMLASAAPDELRIPALVSVKLDGVRCTILDGVAVSRNGKPFRNPAIQEMFGHPSLNGLDGELMVGDPTHPEAFRRSAVVNSLSGDCSEVMFHVFDDASDPQLAFWQRLAAARAKATRPGCVIVEHTMVDDAADLNRLEEEALAAGYEGLMYRDPNGPYKYGRSTTREGYLLKIKRFQDSEAVILDAEELMHNANEKTLVKNGKAVRNTRKEGKIPMGRLGALHVKDIKTGVEFSVGSGFDDAERSALWAEHTLGPGRSRLIGLVIKYQYFPSGSKDKPRFPTFKGFRDAADM